MISNYLPIIFLGLWVGAIVLLHLFDPGTYSDPM